MSRRDLHLDPVAIADLRPTQMTVGMAEVLAKRRAWRQRAADQRLVYLSRHMLPAVRGPKGRLYVIDHHHLARALHDAGAGDVFVTVGADLSHLRKDEFWMVMEAHGWAHPFDHLGHRRPFADMPKSVASLTDDPFRSLAGAVQNAGGYAKEPAPFSEFLWADFFRRRLKPASGRKELAKTVKSAVALARSADAAHLPGWCGRSGPQAL